MRLISRIVTILLVLDLELFDSTVPFHVSGSTPFLPVGYASNSFVPAALSRDESRLAVKHRGPWRGH